MNLTDGSRNPPLAARASTHKLNLVTCELNQRVFLLSPAYAGGERARMVMSEHAQFDLARRLRSKRGATIAEVFSFLSGLYFRGKIAYAIFSRLETPANLTRIHDVPAVDGYLASLLRKKSNFAEARQKCGI